MESSYQSSTMPSHNDSLNTTDEEKIPCDVDPPERIYFTVVGTCIATLGCVCNLLLLFVFLCRRSTKWSLYLIFLAILDFFFCLTFITIFAVQSVAVYFEIETLYLIVRSFAPHQLVFGRIVQVCIPYVLIASSAERLTWIMGIVKMDNGTYHSLAVCIAIAVVWTALRIPSFIALEVKPAEVTGCTFFETLPLVAGDLARDETYQTFDIIVQFFHLFVSFVVLLMLNFLIVHKLRKSHRNARRNSSCPNVLYSTAKQSAINEEKKEAKRLRCAIKTTMVIITSYLLCNSVNFVLYTLEMFFHSLIKDSDNNFYFWYIAGSDCGTILFVVSSAIRLFIYYRYNPAVKSALMTISFLRPFIPRVKKASYQCTLTTRSESEKIISSISAVPEAL